MIRADRRLTIDNVDRQTQRSEKMFFLKELKKEHSVNAAAYCETLKNMH